MSDQETYDIVVGGGGPAGVCAAIAAGRRGAKVCLIEAGGCLGGVWTRGLLSWILDVEDKTGLVVEIMDTLAKEGHGHKREFRSAFAAEPEEVKFLLDSLCAEAGVSVLLHTLIVGTEAKNGRVTSVKTASKAGLRDIRANVFVDATGDGDLSYYAGCDYEIGDENGVVQPASLLGLVTGIGGKDFDKYDNFKNTLTCKAAILADMEKAGVAPSYRAPLIVRTSPDSDLFIVMFNHEGGVKSDDVAAVSRATAHARAELHDIAEKLRAFGGVWKNLRLVATSESLGLREGRRIAGEYRLTYRDLTEGRKFPDAICRVGFNMDIHAAGASSFREDVGEVLPYDIPLRAAIVKGFDNLLTAGRCISGDFLAHSSYRITGAAAEIGEKVGVYAATLLKKRS